MMAGSVSAINTAVSLQERVGKHGIDKVLECPVQARAWILFDLIAEGRLRRDFVGDLEANWRAETPINRVSKCPLGENAF